MFSSHSFNRRAFLKSSGLAVLSFGLGGTPLFLTRASAATFTAANKRRKTLVCIFQRGAMDGLMAVTPFTDAALQAARPRLAMKPSKDASKDANKDGGLIDLDGRFGLHPAFAPFERLYRENRLAIVHGMGSPNSTRSHFDAQDYMENGTPGRKGTATGWLNRALGLMGHDAATTPFRAVAMTPAMPKSLYGTESAIAVTKLEDFGVRVGNQIGNQTGGPQMAMNAGTSFEALYEQTSQKLLRGTGQESFDAVKLLSSKNLASYKPASGANYPASPLGESLRQIAQLIKADVGLEIAFAESGGWDTHVQEGTTQGTFAQRARDLSQAMTAFWTDIEPYQDDVLVMTMTEFGRTVRENGSGGTDHGRGSCLFMLGNNADGGKVHGTVPVLVPENLEDGRDVPVTTDFRAIFSAVADNHLRVTNNAALFPEWNGTPMTLFKHG
jgi:uncharacterized protein (DUF1501 family)